MTPSSEMSSLFIEDPDLVEIGIGELGVAVAPKRLLTPALGSCVGVALYDPVLKQGALAHVMLPRPAVSSPVSGELRGRFADWAVPEMVRRLEFSGSPAGRLEAKLAGGAAMFKGDATIAGVGDRNVAEVRKQLALASVRVVAEDTGDAYARTVELVLATGEFLVRSYQFGVRRI